ncbi:uncharacterized protein K452DRAFT_339538 [Aplosporella prunicola CBS 121167]|uniref:Uncharacterized protein n=1 Tax=Aplosporella prunicola CBS 121167 TaxID=1176127 RepID=A0A6A6B3N5_9PEZI|nr:uncharacterized protein K452DRAFT_339538 [Aplosporella prunicola CBS 121167]KAF2137875.1 hypothetical protein K452DRAFT_339538 [Aplosporella prunicola CBS 121167]
MPNLILRQILSALLPIMVLCPLICSVATILLHAWIQIRERRAHLSRARDSASLVSVDDVELEDLDAEGKKVDAGTEVGDEDCSNSSERGEGDEMDELEDVELDRERDWAMRWVQGWD